MALPALTRERALASPHAHSLVQLEHGHVHFELGGPEGGPPLVLVHGLTSPMCVWDPVVDALADLGHRVLRYDLYGRGLSARPEGVRYGLRLFEDQLDQLLTACAIGPACTLVAFSWGCGVAASFAVRHPSRVAGLVLLAPGGLRGSHHDGSLAALRAPLLGDLIAATVGMRGLRQDLRRCFVDPDAHPWFAERFEEQLGFRGYREAFLSTLRHCPRDFEAAYAQLGRSALPVRLLWGERDAKVPFACHERFLELVPRATLHPLGPVGHAAQVEAPAAFVRAALGG